MSCAKKLSSDPVGRRELFCTTHRLFYSDLFVREAFRVLNFISFPFMLSRQTPDNNDDEREKEEMRK